MKRIQENNKYKYIHLITYISQDNSSISYNSKTVETIDSQFSIKEWNDFADILNNSSKNWLIVNDVLIKN